MRVQLDDDERAEAELRGDGGGGKSGNCTRATDISVLIEPAWACCPPDGGPVRRRVWLGRSTEARHDSQATAVRDSSREGKSMLLHCQCVCIMLSCGKLP